MCYTRGYVFIFVVHRSLTLHMLAPVEVEISLIFVAIPKLLAANSGALRMVTNWELKASMF